MARTLTPLPTDRGMWRRLFRIVHPDTGGEHDLFIWVQALQDHVAGDTYEEPPPLIHREPPQHQTSSAGDRIDFVAAYTNAANFHELTRLAVAMADDVGEPYAPLLRMLSDCYGAVPNDPMLHRHQHEGATYKSAAAVAYRAGFSKAERIRWYRICEAIPLSQRHIGHLLMKFQDAAA